MKQLLIKSGLLLGLVLLLAACRPPSLEQAIIDYNGGRYDIAFESAKKATEKFPQNAEAWYYLGEIYGKKGNVEEMVAAFDKSLALENKYEPQIKRAKMAHFTQNYNNAIQYYNSYVKLEDKESEKAKKALEGTISSFEKSLQIKSDYQAYRLIAISYLNLGDDTNNLKYLKKAAVAEPDTAQAWVELGYYYFQKKDYVKAAENFKKGTEVDPKNTECATMYAQSLDFGDRKQEAIEAYKKAIETNPEEKAIPFNLGLLIYKEARNDGVSDEQKASMLKEAAKYFNSALSLDSSIKEIYDILGAIYIELEDYTAGEDLLKKGLELFPDSATIWSNLSVIYAKQNKLKEAREAYKKAEQLK